MTNPLNEEPLPEGDGAGIEGARGYSPGGEGTIPFPGPLDESFGPPTQEFGQGWQAGPPPQGQGWQQGPYQQAAPPQQGWQQAPGQGYQQYPPGYDPLAKSRVAAGVLGILFGSLGVHNFYTGYMQTAWIQLGCTIGSVVLTILTLGLFSPIASVVIPGVAVWGLVEGIMFLTQRVGHYSTDATGRPLRD